MAKKTNGKLPPAKCIITMGVKITQTKYVGKVSGVDMLNAVIIMMRDTQTLSGMSYKEIFAIVDGGLDAGVFGKKPTMRASESEKTALSDIE